MRHGMHLSAVSFIHMSADVRHGLQLSSMIYIHRAANVGHRQPTLFIACTYWCTDVRVTSLPGLWLHTLVCWWRMHFIDELRHMQRQWLSSSQQHANIHAVQKSKEFETLFLHNNIFIYFALFIFKISASRGSFLPIT